MQSTNKTIRIEETWGLSVALNHQRLENITHNCNVNINCNNCNVNHYFQAESGVQLGGKRKKLEVSAVFNQDEEDESNDQSRKLKLSLPSDEDKRVSCTLWFIIKFEILLTFGYDSAIQWMNV